MQLHIGSKSANTVVQGGVYDKLATAMLRPSFVPCHLALALLITVSANSLLVSATRNLHQASAASMTSMSEDYYRAGCDNFTLDQWQPHRPGYHITVPYGWMNDPVGMFQAPNGRSHVFIQYNPKAVQWGAPFWGHVASDDLAHWTWLPPALLPDKPYDFNGCWSGGTTVTTEGVPILTYTAAGTDIPELGNKFQRQASAHPANMSDPWLKQWVKPDTNPFLAQLPPGGINTQFRDPTEGRHGVWLALTSANNPHKLADGSYALAIGGQAYCLGNAAMYVAPNITGPWRYIGNLYNQLAIEPEINGQCMAGGPAAPANYSGPSYGGPCDQFGAACRAWEVVDFLELEPGLFALKWNDQSRYRRDFALEWYTLGNGPFNYKALAPPSDLDAAGLYASSGNNSDNAALESMSQALAQANDALMQLTIGDSNTQEVFGREYSTYGNATANQMNQTVYGRDTAYNFVNASDESATEVLFQAQLNGRKYYPQIMDYGSIYASMVYRTNDSRQVMYTWAYETAAGCANQCSDEATALTNITNFKSVLNLPRHLTYDRETETMRVYPVNETELLRSGQAYAGSDVVVPALPSTFVLLNETAIQNTTNTTARQWEAQLWFNLTAGTSGSGNASAGQPFKVGARVLTGNNTYVDVFINGTTASGADNTTNSANNASNADAARVATMFIWVDRSNAGGYTNTTFVEGGPVPTPVTGSWLLSDTKLQLSMFIDHSMWEVYAQGGLGRVTSRVYPSDDTVDWGLGVFGDAGSGGQVLMDGAVWNMENAWLPPNCD